MYADVSTCPHASPDASPPHHSTPMTKLAPAAVLQAIGCNEPGIASRDPNHADGELSCSPKEEMNSGGGKGEKPKKVKAVKDDGFCEGYKWEGQKIAKVIQHPTAATKPALRTVP